MQRQTHDSFSWLLKLVAIPVTLLSWVQTAVGREYTFSDHLMEMYYPGTYFNYSKFPLDCIASTHNLTLRISNMCHVTMLQLADVTGKMMLPVNVCPFTEPENLQHAKSCIANMVFYPATESNVSHTLFIPTAITTFSLATMTVIIFYTVKCMLREYRQSSYVNHMMELIDAIRHGDQEAVSDYLRLHHHSISAADLQYALTIAEQTAQDACYLLVSLVLIDKLAENAMPRVAIIEEEDHTETNEKKLLAIGYPLSKIPAALLDPVDQSIMDNPVTLSTQQNIDQRTLQKLAQFKLFKCPMTNLPVNEREFNYPVNTGLKEIIDNFVAKKVKKYSQ